MPKVNETFRTETDSLGDVKVPSWAYWGAQTQRAVDNFSVSDLRIPVPLIKALGLVKEMAAEVNHGLGLLDEPIAKAIMQAAREMAEGNWNDHFPIDVFQTGSGTSWNMNANEVIANRANEILGHPRGVKKPVHPNDHVNRGQSSNDVIPTVISMADREEAGEAARALGLLQESLERKSREFTSVLKIGRTHLQDAVPMTLGQELLRIRASGGERPRDSWSVAFPIWRSLPSAARQSGRGSTRILILPRASSSGSPRKQGSRSARQRTSSRQSAREIPRWS